MKDEWNERLRCPLCLKTGTVSLCQAEDDDLPTIQSVPDGFKVIKTEDGLDFQCVACEVMVEP